MIQATDILITFIKTIQEKFPDWSKEDHLKGINCHICVISVAVLLKRSKKICECTYATITRLDILID